MFKVSNKDIRTILLASKTKRNKNIYLENPINFNNMTRQTRMTNNHDKQLEKRNNDVYNPIL